MVIFKGHGLMVGKCTTVALYVHTSENSWNFDSHKCSETLASCEVFCTANHQAISPELSFLSSTTVYVWGLPMYLYDMFLQTSWLVLRQTITNTQALLYRSVWTRWFVVFSFDSLYESFGLCLQQLDLCEPKTKCMTVAMIMVIFVANVGGFPNSALAFNWFGQPTEEKDPVEPFTLYGSILWVFSLPICFFLK